MNLKRHFACGLAVSLALGSAAVAHEHCHENVEPVQVPSVQQTLGADVAEQDEVSAVAVPGVDSASANVVNKSVEAAVELYNLHNGRYSGNQSITDGEGAIKQLESEVLGGDDVSLSQTDDPEHTFDMDKSVATSLSRNHSVKAADEAIVQAEARYEQAQSGMNVKGSVSNVTTYQNRIVSGGAVVAKNWCNQLIASVSKILTTFGKIENQIAAAYTDITTEQLNAMQTRHELKYKVKQAFLERLKADSNVDVALLHLDLTQQSRKDADRMYQQGVKAYYDVIQSDIDVTDAEEQVACSKTAVDISEAELLELLEMHRHEGDPTLKLLRPASIEVDPACTLDALKELALKKRYELQVIDSSLESLRKLYDSADAQNLEIGVNGSYIYSHNHVGVEPNCFQLNLNIGWEFLDGGEREASKKELKAQMSAVDHERHELCHGIELEVETAWRKFKLTDVTMHTARKRVGAAWVYYAMSRQRFLNGLSTSLEVNSALNSLNSARKAFVVASYDRDLAFAALEYSVGVDFPDRKLAITPELEEAE